MLRLAHMPVGEGTPHEAGRQLLGQLYEEATGQPLPEIQKGSRGKPYFPESPWHFSITHTPGHAFCALSDRPVGIDAEELTRQVSPRLAEKILSPSEYARYEAAPDKNRALLTLWVLKEAQGKLTGQGINGYPNKTDFTPDDPRVTQQHGCLLAVITE